MAEPKGDGLIAQTISLLGLIPPTVLVQNIFGHGRNTDCAGTDAEIIGRIVGSEGGSWPKP